MSAVAPLVPGNFVRSKESSLSDFRIELTSLPDFRIELTSLPSEQIVNRVRSSKPSSSSSLDSDGRSLANCTASCIVPVQERREKHIGPKWLRNATGQDVPGPGNVCRRAGGVGRRGGRLGSSRGRPPQAIAVLSSIVRTHILLVEQHGGQRRRVIKKQTKLAELETWSDRTSGPSSRLPVLIISHAQRISRFSRSLASELSQELLALQLHAHSTENKKGSR